MLVFSDRPTWKVIRNKHANFIPPRSPCRESQRTSGPTCLKEVKGLKREVEIYSKLTQNSGS